MQNKELSKISPTSLFVLAIIVFVSSTVSIFVNRLFANADILDNDHTIIADLGKTVDRIIKTVDGKVDTDNYVTDIQAIKSDIEEIKKNNQEMRLDIKALLSRKQVYQEPGL